MTNEKDRGLARRSKDTTPMTTICTLFYGNLYTDRLGCDRCGQPCPSGGVEITANSDSLCDDCAATLDPELLTIATQLRAFDAALHALPVSARDMRGSDLVRHTMGLLCEDSASLRTVAPGEPAA